MSQETNEVVKGLDNFQEDFGTQPMTQPLELDGSKLEDLQLEWSQEDEWEKQ